MPNVMRQALAGMLWSKQYYNYDVGRWLRGARVGPASRPATTTPRAMTPGTT